MDGNVKPDRPHGIAAPQARTRRTKASVVDAARRLFEERGYAATTIEAISERSDTPQATIYRLFASKLGILKAVIDVAIVGDDEDVAMADRPQVQELLAHPDAHQRLAQFAALLRELMARHGAGSPPAGRRRPVRPGCGVPARRDRPPAPAGPAAHRPIPRPIGRARSGAAGARRRRHHPCAGVPRGLRPARPRPRLERRALRALDRLDARRPAARVAGTLSAGWRSARAWRRATTRPAAPRGRGPGGTRRRAPCRRRARPARWR